MKKITALALVIIMTATVLCSCGNFNMESIDPLDYVTLGDYNNFSLDEFRAAYEEEREAIGAAQASFNVDWGYTVIANIVCEIVGGDDKSVTYTRYDDFCYERDNTARINIYEDTDNAYRANFDSALVYNTTNASNSSTTASLRTIKVGTAFDFLYTMPYMADNAEISLKTLRFTVTPVKVLAPVYSDTYITDALNAFLKVYSEDRKTVGMGDIVTANIEGKINDELFDGSKYEGHTFVVGCSEFPIEFDEKLVDAKVGKKTTFDVTFPDDWSDSEIAGKTATFTVKVTDAYNYNKAVSENTKYSSLYELKEELRLASYVNYTVVSTVYERSELKSDVKALYNEYYKYFKSTSEQNIKDNVEYYNSIGQKVTKEEMINDIYGSADEYENYIVEIARQTMKETLVCYALCDAMGVEYTSDDYKKDIKQFAESYNSSYGTEYSESKVEKLCGKNIIKMVFMEDKLAQLLCEKVEGLIDTNFGE